MVCFCSNRKRELKEVEEEGRRGADRGDAIRASSDDDDDDDDDGQRR